MWNQYGQNGWMTNVVDQKWEQVQSELTTLFDDGGQWLS